MFSIGVCGAIAGSGSSKGNLDFAGGVGTKLPYCVADCDGPAAAFDLGIGTGGVFFNCANGSSDDSSEFCSESLPSAAGDARRGAAGSSSGPSNLWSVEGAFVLVVKGDVAPYRLRL